MPSVKKNFAFNLILTVSTYLFSLVVFPYVSRVLGVELIGRISFAEQVIRYFMLFASMGLATVGIREISSCGDDRERRSRVFSNIFVIALLLTSISIILLFVAIFTVSQLSSIKDLLIIGSFNIFFTTLLIEWFYQGIENFRFVTLRSIAVKCFYVLAVFLFVKTKDDYILYYIINAVCTAVNALINIFYSRRFVDLSFRRLTLGKYFKPSLSLGIYQLALSFFTTFNVVYLGFVQTEYQTGLYTTAIKIYSILLAVISAFTTVMMPRMSALLSEEREDEFNSKLAVSWNLVFAFSIPIAIGGIILSPQIVTLLAGEAFAEAALPMSIIMLNILIVSAAQIWVMQVLLPMKKDRVVLYCSILSAAVGVLLNFLLVGNYGALGSAITIVVAELVGDIVSFIYVIRKHIIKFPMSMFLKYMVLSMPYILICLVVRSLSLHPIICLIVAVFSCLLYFIVLHRWVVKDTFISGYVRKVMR